MVILYEVAAKKIIPLLKGVIVHELYREGYSQRKIASLINITQPQVYKYLSRDINYYYSQLEKLGFDLERIKYYVSLLVDLLKKKEMIKYIVLINGIIHELTVDYVCREYSLPEKICRNGRLSDPDIEYYREWLDRIIKLPGLAQYIPEVGSNIVYAPVKPHGLSDIIGLTGRIVRVHNVIRVVGEPVYGGSRHLSRVLLLAVKYDKHRRVAMNISYDKTIEKLSSRYQIEYSGPHESIENFWAELDNVLRKKPDIVLDLGGYGLEPITYILANSFEELEKILRELIKKSSV